MYQWGHRTGMNIYCQPTPTSKPWMAIPTTNQVMAWDDNSQIANEWSQKHKLNPVSGHTDLYPDDMKQITMATSHGQSSHVIPTPNQTKTKQNKTKWQDGWCMWNNMVDMNLKRNINNQSNYQSIWETRSVQTDIQTYRFLLFKHPKCSVNNLTFTPPLKGDSPIVANHHQL